jgi:hypothetical protein
MTKRTLELLISHDILLGNKMGKKQGVLLFLPY